LNDEGARFSFFRSSTCAKTACRLCHALLSVGSQRARHLVTNLRIKKDDGNEIEVHSNFLISRTRMETDRDLFVGARLVILRCVSGSFKLAQPTIILDQAVLDAKNISVFL
jgi:3-phenylpropionate/cinnamic acid dioxygenase small subunit